MRQISVLQTFSIFLNFFTFYQDKVCGYKVIKCEKVQGKYLYSQGAVNRTNSIIIVGETLNKLFTVQQDFTVYQDFFFCL